MLPLTPTSTYTPGAPALSRSSCGPALGVMPLEALPVACGLTPAWSLPLIQQIVSPREGAPSRHPGPGFGREQHRGAAEVKAPALRVLVVDDNRDAADSLCLLLRTWGFVVRVAKNSAFSPVPHPASRMEPVIRLATARNACCGLPMSHGAWPV